MTLFQFNFRNQTFAFKFKLGFFLLCVFFFVLFCCLGVWQLHRYAYKKTLLTQYQENIKAEAVPFAQLIANKDLSFRETQVEGEYLNQLTMFLQNRFYKDQIGYDVLTPFRVKDDGTLLLIDRGWIPAHDNQPPADVKPALASTAITGYIKLLNEYQFMLGKNILNPNEKPIVMQKIDTAELSRLLHQPFYPFVLRLNANAAAGFVRDWPIVMVMPQRHMGYAIQWFVMAIVLLIAYCGFCVERADCQSIFHRPAASLSRRPAACPRDPIDSPGSRGQAAGRRDKDRRPHYPFLFIILIFSVPIALSYLLYCYHDNFHFKTTNYGQLIEHPYQVDINHEKKWQVVFVAPAHCDSVCANQFFYLQQMRKLLGKEADRVDVLQLTPQPHEKLAVNRIYLIDPLHNVFMYYPNTVNVMNILKDLKKVLEVSQIG